MASATRSKKKNKGKSPNTNPHNEHASAASPSEERFTHFFRKESPFSQWHTAVFKVGQNTFSCAEQFMMYQKAILFNDEETAQEILSTDDPKDHKALGRKVKNFDETVWKENREDIVKKGNLAKFGQNDSLREILFSTKGTTLVEASPYDRIWGIGLEASNPKAHNRATWRGANLLGKILTEVREELMKKTEAVEDDTNQSNSVGQCDSSTLFTNWCRGKFQLEKAEFSCVEQFLMYQKAIFVNDQETAQKILEADSASKLEGLLQNLVHQEDDDEKVWREKWRDIVKEKLQTSPQVIEEVLTCGALLFEAALSATPQHDLSTSQPATMVEGLEPTTKKARVENDDHNDDQIMYNEQDPHSV